MHSGIDLKQPKTKPNLDKRHTLFGTTANTASLCIVAPIRKPAAWLVPKTKDRHRNKRNKDMKKQEKWASI